MTLQAVRSLFEAPVLAAYTTLGIPLYVDNQGYVENDAITEYGLMRIDFSSMTEDTLGESLEAITGNFTVECFTKKGVGPGRAQEIMTAVIKALNDLNTCKPHPATGAYGKVFGLNGPNFYTLDRRPYLYARVNGSFRASYT